MIRPNIADQFAYHGLCAKTKTRKKTRRRTCVWMLLHSEVIFPNIILSKSRSEKFSFSDLCAREWCVFRAKINDVQGSINKRLETFEKRETQDGTWQQVVFPYKSNEFCAFSRVSMEGIRWKSLIQFSYSSLSFIGRDKKNDEIQLARKWNSLLKWLITKRSMSSFNTWLINRFFFQSL